MKKLAVILPYNEEHIENFTEHFKATVKGDYKLCFIKQKSNRTHLNMVYIEKL